MIFKKESPDTYYLYETYVENIYISEYMASAPGDYVKVYLMALMYAQTEQEVSSAEFAKQLMLEEQEINKAFAYWISLGILAQGRNPDEPIRVISLRESLYGNGKNKDISEKQGLLYDAAVKDMYRAVEKAVARPLSSSEVIEISAWLSDFSATPEVIIYAYTYCCSTLKKSNINYVGKIVKEWTMKGLTDVGALDEYIEEIDKKKFLYKRIFKALGFMRNPTEEEKRIMESWFSELDFSIDKILEACSKTAGITNPNIKYIDKVLRGWAKDDGKGVLGDDGHLPAGIVIKYYNYLREKGEQEAAARRGAVYQQLPEMLGIDKEIRNKNMELSRIMISDMQDKTEQIKRINAEVDEFRANRAAILTDNNYPIDYMDATYICSLCKDTGTNENGERCVCFEQRAEEAKQWQSSTTKMKTK